MKTTYTLFMYLFVGRTYFGLKMSFFVKLLKVPLVGCHGNKNKKCSELFYSLHFKNQVLIIKALYT